jgi:hypothetical protein
LGSRLAIVPKDLFFGEFACSTIRRNWHSSARGTPIRVAMLQLVRTLKFTPLHLYTESDLIYLLL